MAIEQINQLKQGSIMIVWTWILSGLLIKSLALDLLI